MFTFIRNLYKTGRKKTDRGQPMQTKTVPKLTNIYKQWTKIDTRVLLHTYKSRQILFRNN